MLSAHMLLTLRVRQTDIVVPNCPFDGGKPALFACGTALNIEFAVLWNPDMACAEVCGYAPKCQVEKIKGPGNMGVPLVAAPASFFGA